VKSSNKNSHSLSTKSIMQKPSRQGRREALKLVLTPSDFAIKFPDEELQDSDSLLKQKAANPKGFEEENPPQHEDVDLSLKKATAGAVDGTGPNSTPVSDSLSSTALVQQERNQRTTHDTSNKVKLPPSRDDETMLQEKERIAGRSRAIHTKKAFPAGDYKVPNKEDETMLQEKERIAGRSKAIHAKKAVPADDYKLPSRRDETILQEKERIAGRSKAVHAKKVVPADDYKSPTGRDETILQEKERIAGRSKAVHAKKVVPADEYKSPSGRDETILQEKERKNTGRRTVQMSKAFPVDVYNSTGVGDETILDLDSDQANLGAFRMGGQDIDDETIPYLESDQAIPGAFRIGGQDNDDDNTVAYGEEVRIHGTTTDVASEGLV
jgi:hypothetical protein